MSFIKLQPAKAKLQGMKFIVFYKFTMIVFIGHPLQPDLSDCRLQVNQNYSLKWGIRSSPVLIFNYFHDSPF